VKPLRGTEGIRASSMNRASVLIKKTPENGLQLPPFLCVRSKHSSFRRIK
jgi:hypothetical protein